MSTSLIILIAASLLYAIFLLWYVGFQKPLSKIEIDYYIKEYSKFNNSRAELIDLRNFLEKDTGKSFVMVNSILLKKKPDLVEGVKEGDTSLQTLMNYYKPFMRKLLRRGGISIFQGRVAANSFDLINVENAK